MILFSVSTLALGFVYGATGVFAMPKGDAFPPYQPPSKGDARSACPGINALANHGFLNHNGRNISYDMLLEAARTGFGFDLEPLTPGFVNNVFATAVTDPANIAVHPENTTFDLDKVNTHNGPIEFDGSLSRKDHFFGSDVAFDRPTWDTQWRLMKEEQKASGSTGDSFDLGVAARARARHVLIKSQAGNKEFLFTPDTLSNSAGTTGLFTMVLGGMTRSVRKDWLWAFFVEERIPYKEGFQPQKDVTTENLNTLTGEIIAAAPRNLTCSFDPDAPCP
ncbi:hypothetical protein Daus18300_008074 [Diaporthe australafricana]|uniref:Heme haloperoxidase family profile domain-containing protein n=1 Tax=Diaporthe australafricana TaxID=127596 RepID=A0ABR3WKC5_9PEZI